MLPRVSRIFSEIDRAGRTFHCKSNGRLGISPLLWGGSSDIEDPTPSLLSFRRGAESDPGVRIRGNSAGGLSNRLKQRKIISGRTN